MINLVVAGGGEQTYKNLHKATLSKNPDLGMKIAAVIDTAPREKLHPEMQKILEAGGIPLLHPNELEKFSFPENAAGAIMTPNASHLWYAEFFAARGVPFYLEKPAVRDLGELEKFLALAKKHPKLVYAAEYCTDGKALALLDLGGTIRPNDPRRAYIDASPDIKSLYANLGALRSIRGTMLEGEGTAATVEHRPWSLEGSQGGMIRDLAPHLIGPLHDLGFTSESEQLRATLGRYETGRPRGTWRALKSAEEGETYAKINGVFRIGRARVNFEFEVGKYWPKHDRMLSLAFENGRVDFSYEKPFEATIETGSRRSTAKVTADFYPSLAFLDFKEFLEGKTGGHIDRAAAIVEFNERARQAGLREAGLC